MAEIAKGWIQVIPSFQNFKKAVAEVLGETEGPLKEQSRRWSDTIKTTLGGAFKTAATAGAVALGAAAAGIASYAGEAISASDATEKFASTLKFAGLDSGVIERLKTATKQYANQTVYNLSDIQNTTAQLAANGVEGFDRLAMAAGNLNAVAGGDAQTFKSVGQVVTQTAGAGKLMTENWRQLTDAIPGAAGRLKDALLSAGAYTGDFSQAMSDGQITAEEFNQAILSLGFEEAAVETASSTSMFQNAWGNLEAAIVDGIGKIIEPFKGPLTDVMSGAADKITAFFTMISEAITGFQSGEGIDFTSIFSGLGPVAGLVAGFIGPLLANLPMVGQLFTGLTGPVGLVIGLFVQMIANSSSLRESLFNAFQSIMQSLIPLGPVFEQIMGVIGEIATQLGNLLAPAIDLVAGVIVALMPTIVQVIEFLTSLIQAVLPGLTPIIQSIIDVIGFLTPYVLQIVDIIGQVVSALMDALAPVIPIVGEALSQFGELFQQIVNDYGMPFIAFVMSVIIPAVQSLIPTIKTITSVISNIISGVMEFIKGIIQTALSILRGDWSGAWEGIKTATSGAINTLMSIIGGVPALIGSVFSGAGNLLWNAGKAIIQGFIDGISYMFSAVKNTLSSLTNLLPSWKGPADVDKTILRKPGQLVIQGFNRGLEESFNSLVKPTLQGFTRELNIASPTFETPSKNWTHAGANVNSSGNIYIDTIVNPVAEPTSVSANRELQKLAVIGGF